MPKFSVAHGQAFAVLEQANKLNNAVTRQVRQGHAAQGESEIQRTAYAVKRSVELLSDVLARLAEQTQTLDHEQVGDVSHAELIKVAEKIRASAALLPNQPA